MPKQTIAVDIDDVISAQNDHMRKFANRNYGHNHTREEFLNAEADYWGYWQHVWGVSKEEQDKRVKHYSDSGELLKQKTVPDAIDAIRKLKNDYNLVVVTSRHDDYINHTHQWLDIHFPKIFSDVHFVSVWSKDNQSSKASICQAVGAGYLIDDNAAHCNLAAEVGVLSLLFGDYGWNRKEKLSKGVVRVKNWQEVLNYFEK